MEENVGAEIIASYIVLGLAWTLLPSALLLKPKLLSIGCKVVPGGTPEDVAFYWNHWAIRLTVALFLLGIGIILWEWRTGTEVSPLIEAARGTILLVLFSYIAVGEWRRWRQWLQRRRK